MYCQRACIDDSLKIDIVGQMIRLKEVAVLVYLFIEVSSLTTDPGICKDVIDLPVFTFRRLEYR